MFKAEARWLYKQIAALPAEQVTPVLNIGSSTQHFREVEQPWTSQELFAPLRASGIRVIHLDFREGDGIDVRADILGDEDVPRLKALRANSILCCNILEHVREPERLAARCLQIVQPGGLVFVTVPFSYPYHRDPIDTMYRPSPEELAKLFAPARMVRGEVLDVEESYRDKIRQRPWILLRHALRAPIPFVDREKWRRSMRKLYWLKHNYEVTAAVFRAPGA
ncbi:MAG: hypothetical protein JO208_15325 [Alphaproteobacteria bacterium]|nr:hypothetical protein [Alphaproteobacteria bacterium]